MISKIFLFILFFVSGFISEARSDTIYLRNGRSIEGLIEKEDDDSVELNVGFGTVKFKREAIESINRSSPEEVALMRQEWQRQKKLEENKRIKRRQELEEARRKKELEPKEIEFYQRSEDIVVNALLNNKINVSFLLDTGASVILLSSRIAKKLGIKTPGAEDQIVEAQMADGHKVKATYIVLDNVNVEGVEARDVGAIVLSDESQMEIQDGLLGMSFLNRFNFRIDSVNKKLILERLKPQEDEK